jgi:predicted thioesterase
MARDIELTCRDMVFENLDDGEDSVGARIEVDHLGATLVNSWVDVTATVVDVDGRRVTLEIEVEDPLDVVGKARHVRFVIDKERQRARLEAKAAKLKEVGG